MKSDLRRAAATALNRTADGARSVAVKDIASDLGVRQKSVRDAVGLNRAIPSRLEARIVARGKRIPLSDFAAAQTKKGVTYRMRGLRKLLPNAFIARMKSGHRGVFKRRGKERLSIDERFGPSIPLIFTRKKIQQAIRAVVDERLVRELIHQFEYYTRRNR